ncbi:MAG TPA: GGDEF domain-containing protein [Gemmatimonadaceae bacterium]
MSSPAAVDRPVTAETLAPRRSSASVELMKVTTELDGALRDEKARLTRDVLSWQQWIRYLVVGTLILTSLVFGELDATALIALAILAAAYVGVVMGTTWWLRRIADGPPGAWIPSVLLIADTAMLAGFTYLTSQPEQLHRILLLGFLSMQLAAFYFGGRYGVFAAVLAIVSYLALALSAPVFVAGPRPSILAAMGNVTFFAVVSAVSIYAFAALRQRLDALRMYCKVVEHGDTALLPPLPSERWPDELTLLTRSFQSMHSRLAEQVGSDALTGCLNRRALEARLRADLRSARRRGSTVAVATVDLDNFKEINDSRGHPVGDLVLQQFAAIMNTIVRETDAVARYGGDEFVVVLPDTGWQGALTFADRLRRHVNDYSFGPPNAPPLGVTISVGVALSRASDGNTSDGLLQEADAALYRAKTAGRNRVFS